MESIEARVHPLVLELVNRPEPEVGLEGKFSFQHSMAVALVDGAAFPDQYTDARVSDPTVADMRSRVKATIDSSLAEDAAVVTIALRDGSKHTETVVHATGAPENPLSDAQLEDKFRSLTADVLSRARCKKAAGPALGPGPGGRHRRGCRSAAGAPPVIARVNEGW